MTIFSKQLRLFLCIAGALAGGQAAAGDWFDRHGRAPVGDRVYVCHGYTCRVVTPVSLSAAEIGRIVAPLLGADGDADAERQALSRSVAVFVNIVGARIGTSGDLPAMQFGQDRKSTRLNSS